MDLETLNSFGGAKPSPISITPETLVLFGGGGSTKTSGKTSRESPLQARVKGDFSHVTASEIAPYLGAGLKPYASDFVEAGQKFRLDPRFLASISKLETGNGTSPAFRKGNNAMGISNSRGPLYHFKSPRESIFRQAESLARPTGHYRNASTIAEIGPIYAPPRAGNDPRGTNSHWPKGVGKFYAEMTGGATATPAASSSPTLRARRSQSPDTLERSGALPNEPGTVMENAPPVPIGDATNSMRTEPERENPDQLAPKEPAALSRPPVPQWTEIRTSDTYRHASSKERHQALEKWSKTMQPYLADQGDEVTERFRRKVEVERLRIDTEDPAATITDAFRRGVLSTESARELFKATESRKQIDAAMGMLNRTRLKLRPGEALFYGTGQQLELPEGKKARILEGTKEAGIYAVPPETKGSMNLEQFETWARAEIHEHGNRLQTALRKSIEAGDLAKALPQSREVREFLETEGGKASAGVLLRNFPAIAAHTIAESAPGIVAPVTGGAVAGPTGAAGGSFAVEYANSFRDFLEEEAGAKGVDTSTEEGLAQALMDEDIVSRAELRASKRAAPIAGVDAVTMGLGGLLARKIAGTTAGQIAKRALVATPLDAAGGAVGELAAQGASGQEIDAKAATLEAVGQVATGAASNLMETARAISAPRNEANTVTNPDANGESAPASATEGNLSPVSAPRPLSPEPIPDTAEGAAGLGATMAGTETRATMPAARIVHANETLADVETTRARITQRLEAAAQAGEVATNGKETLPITPAGREMMERAAEERIALNAREAEARQTLEEAATLASGPITPDVSPPEQSTESPTPSSQGGVEANLFTPQREQRARQIDEAVKAGKPVSLGDIRRFIVDRLDVPLRFGIRRHGKLASALGIYKTRPEMTRVRQANDIETLAHEIGHHLHYTTLGPGRTADARGNPTATDFATDYDAEILPLGHASGTYQSASEKGKTASLARREGVAEFVRHWLNEPARAIKEAPQFAAYFEQKLRQDHPEVLSALTRAQSMIARYHAQPAEMQLEAQIAFDEKGASVRRTPREWVHSIYRTWFDSLGPLTRMSRDLERLGVPKAIAETFDLRAHNYTSGWASKAQGDLIFEQRDLTGEKVKGDSLKRILRGLDEEGRRDFSKYLVAKRAQELRARGIAPGVPIQSKETMQRWANRFEARRKKLLRFQDNAMQLLVDSGVINRNNAEAMREANQDYVPFYRLVERFGSPQSVAGSMGTEGQGFVNLDAGIRRIKGSELEIVDPLESIVRNVMMFRQIAERNLVGREFVDAVSQARGGGKIADQIAAKRRSVQVSHEQMVRALIDAGVIKKAADLPKGTASLAFKFWEQVAQPKAADGEVVIRRNGVRENWQIMEPDVYRALTLADADDMQTFKRVMPLAPLFTKATALLRTGATLTPEFIIRNPIRDQVIAGVNSRNGYIPFWDGVRGVLSVISRDETYRDWMAAGGAFSGPIGAHRQNLQEYLSQHIQDRNAREQALYLANVPKRLIEALQFISETTEAATRVSEFRRARESGKGMTESAMDAKDVTLDFSRSGPAGKALNLMVAFLNAGLQDMDKMRREATERPGNFVKKNLLYITAPTLALAFLNKDDEEIQNLPDWRRNFFWNINLGRLLNREDWILSLPKPFALGAVFGTLPERAIDWAGGRDPNGLKKAGQAVWQNTLFRGDLMASVSLFRPMLENMMNYSLFTGGPIVPQRMQAVAPRYQFDPGRTSEFARVVGGQLNVSPMKIDNVVRGHFGGLGRHSTDFIDFSMQQLYQGEIPERPSKSWEEWPGVRAFTQGPYTPGIFVDRFYKALDRAEGRMKTFQEMNALMSPEEAEKWWKENGAATAHYGALLDPRDDAKVITQLRRVQRSLSDVHKAMRQIYADKTMSADEKRERLIYLNALRNHYAEEGFKRWVFEDDKRAVY